MRFAGLAAGWILSLGVAAGASDSTKAERVSAALRASGRLESDVRALCDGIGARMAGTDAMDRALEWARTSFAQAGLESVRLEPVPMPLRWEEGETAINVLEPSEYRVRALSSGLSPALAEAREAELVDGGKGYPGHIARSPERFRDRIPIITLDEVGSFEDLGVEQRDAVVALREAAQAGALAVLFVSTRRDGLMYRHVNSISGGLDPIPSAVVAREDGLRLVRTLQGGERVRVRIRLPNRIRGSYSTANVLAEIPGDNLPDEVVLLGAHLDSWDIGTGCQDNAVNVALVLHVARSIVEGGVRPRRTLRFALFGGEEFGLFGSRAYAAAYRDEMDDHVATIVHDMGNGELTGYSVGGRRELLSELRRILDPVDPAGRLRHTDDPFFFSDNFTFMLHGVPSLFGVQDTSAFYRTYHSAADTYDNVRVENVIESAVVAAGVMLGIADGADRFGSRLEHGELLERANRQGLVRHLEFLGVREDWLPSLESSGPGPH